MTWCWGPAQIFGQEQTKSVFFLSPLERKYYVNISICHKPELLCGGGTVCCPTGGGIRPPAFAPGGGGRRPPPMGRALAPPASFFLMFCDKVETVNESNSIIHLCFRKSAFLSSSLYHTLNCSPQYWSWSSAPLWSWGPASVLHSQMLPASPAHLPASPTFRDRVSQQNNHQIISKCTPRLLESHCLQPTEETELWKNYTSVMIPDDS